MSRGLIVFARDPIPGRVKTRLAATVGDVVAARLYETMIRDVLQTAHRLDGVAVHVVWDCQERALARLAESFCCCSRRQTTGTLGERMASAFAELFAEGYTACCIIGSDAPDLPPSYIHDGFHLVESAIAQVAFGPCPDGGYYLLAMGEPHPELFSGIPWGTDYVLKQSRDAACHAGLTVALLPEWQDIDTLADFQAFQQRTEGKGTRS